MRRARLRLHVRLRVAQENQVLDGWLDSLYDEGVAETDRDLAAKIKQDWMRFRREQWDRAQQRRQAMACGESPRAVARAPLESDEEQATREKADWLHQCRR
eukprot:5380566-Prymnesium_polylepis.1